MDCPKQLKEKRAPKWRSQFLAVSGLVAGSDALDLVGPVGRAIGKRIFWMRIGCSGVVGFFWGREFYFREIVLQLKVVEHM